ncbi:MAG: helix-turn-helix domain-containing protein [Solirubrobacterales bacterium]
MALFDLVGRRWTLRVLWELSQAGEPVTFRELKSLCADMSSSVLTRRVAELREAQLVTRHDGGYGLSEMGAGLITSMQPLLAWSRVWASDSAAAEHEGGVPSPPPRHQN